MKTPISAERPTTRNGRLESREVYLPATLLDALAPHAAKRGIHPNTLARSILETVVKEKMVDAVLDDQEAA